MTPRRNDKVVLGHHIRIGVGTQRRSSAFSEEECSRASELHVCEVDAQAAVGAGAEGAEGGFACFALFGAWEPAGGVESVVKRSVLSFLRCEGVEGFA